MERIYEDMLKRLKKFRKTEKISQKELGNIMHITQSHYSKIEKGEKIMSGAELFFLIRSGIDMDYMISGEHVEKSVLNEIIESCEKEKRAELFQLIVWTIHQRVLSGKTGTRLSENCIRELELLRCRTSPHIKDSTIWYKIRKANQMTQVQMAETLSVNTKYYREIEKGKTSAKAEILAVLYKKLGYLPSVIFEDNHGNLMVLNQIWSSFEPEEQKKMESFIRAGTLLIS